MAGAARPGGRGEGTLGVDAAHGRTFAPEDSQNPCTAVLSDAFWHGQLGGASIVGRTLIVNDESCLVVGIMPKDFSFYPKLTQLWMLIPPPGRIRQASLEFDGWRRRPPRARSNSRER